MNDRQWMIPAALVVAVQFIFCGALAVMIGFTQIPLWTKHAPTALSFVLLVVGGWALWSLRHRPGQPIRHLFSLDWSRHLGFALAIVLFCFQFTALTWAKTMLPLVTAFWADVPLANADAALLGRDAWHLLPAPDMAVDVIYLLWLPVVAGFFTALYYSKRPNRSIGLLAFFVTMGVLGTLGQYLLPSGGPIFFERLGLGERFAAMPLAMGVRRVSDLLWNAHEGHYLGYATGISAFPSMHVAGATWIAITFRNPLAIAYALFIFASSIMLGWHYAVDGLSGAAGALACYAMAKAVPAKDWSWKPVTARASNFPV